MDGQVGRIMASLVSETGDRLPGTLDLPLNTSSEMLQNICTAILEQDSKIPFVFFINGQIVQSTIEAALDTDKLEATCDIVYQQQAIFKVQAVTRCTSTIPGHSEAIISSSFSPDGVKLATGSGDTTVRFWDVSTQTPHFVCRGHTNWVLCIAWSPDGTRLASGCKSGDIIVWDPDNGRQVGSLFTGHKHWITALSWEPYHSNSQCRRFASASKDKDVRIWDAVLGNTLLTLSGHTGCVTCVRWGGVGLLYSSSQDRTIKVWRAEDGALCRTLQGHAHWVNTLAVNTECALRTGPFEQPPVPLNLSKDILQEKAREKFMRLYNTFGETLVSGSDDFTLFLWHPEKDRVHLARMTGHQQAVNDLAFSPDARMIASASFDKSIKLWDGRTGKFITTLRGHVQAVYKIAWSADSRLLASASADSTLKVWTVRPSGLEKDLPGHADEVYALDWSTDGMRVVSGGKDKVLKLSHVLGIPVHVDIVGSKASDRAAKAAVCLSPQTVGALTVYC